jgi:hypothetical protein
MDVSVPRTFADVLANRDPNQGVPKESLEFKWTTGKVRSLKIVTRPEACSGKHCRQVKDRCQEKKCINRLQEQLSKTTSENEQTVSDNEERLQSIDELLWEISVHCKTDDLYYPTMEESRLALESALSGKAEFDVCDCIACQLSDQQRVAKVLKQKTAATKTRLQSCESIGGPMTKKHSRGQVRGNVSLIHE